MFLSFDNLNFSIPRLPHQTKKKGTCHTHTHTTPKASPYNTTFSTCSLYTNTYIYIYSTIDLQYKAYATQLPPFFFLLLQWQMLRRRLLLGVAKGWPTHSTIKYLSVIDVDICRMDPYHRLHYIELALTLERKRERKIEVVYLFNINALYVAHMCSCSNCWAHVACSLMQRLVHRKIVGVYISRSIYIFYIACGDIYTFFYTFSDVKMPIVVLNFLSKWSYVLESYGLYRII